MCLLSEWERTKEGVRVVNLLPSCPFCRKSKGTKKLKALKKKNLITKTISLPCVVECRSRLYFSTSLINEHVNNGGLMAPLS